MSSPHHVPFRTFLWEYLGHPDDETPERRRILYALVILRLGFGLFFLLRGWGAIFGSSAEALAVRLGDPARLGLGGAAADTTLFILGCTELGVGALLLFGAFTRVSAVIGSALLLLYLVLGDRSSFDLCVRTEPQFANACGRDSVWLGDFSTLAAALTVVYLAGLLVLVIAGSPFLSADRALDKLEEEERDRAPAILPKLAERASLILRAGIAIAGLWLVARHIVATNDWDLPIRLLSTAIGLASLALMIYAPIVTSFVAGGLFFRAVSYSDFGLVVLLIPAMFLSLGLLIIEPPGVLKPSRRSGVVNVQKT